MIHQYCGRELLIGLRERMAKVSHLFNPSTLLYVFILKFFNLIALDFPQKKTSHVFLFFLVLFYLHFFLVELKIISSWQQSLFNTCLHFRLFEKWLWNICYSVQYTIKWQIYIIKHCIFIDGWNIPRRLIRLVSVVHVFGIKKKAKIYYFNILFKYLLSIWFKSMHCFIQISILNGGANGKFSEAVAC